jgi:hypothetical protein
VPDPSPRSRRPQGLLERAWMTTGDRNAEGLIADMRLVCSWALSVGFCRKPPLPTFVEFQAEAADEASCIASRDRMCSCRGM